MGSYISGLRLLGSPRKNGQAASLAGCPRRDEAECAGTHFPQWRAEHGSDVLRTWPLPAWMEGIFQTRGYAQDFLHAGWVDTPAIESAATQTVETRSNRAPCTTVSRTPRVAYTEGSGLRKTLVVGGCSWCNAHSSAGDLFRAARSTPAGHTQLNSLNRRMRTRMSGGVGGE